MAELKASFIYYTSQHVYVFEVLYGVLYLEAHTNQFQKKKKKTRCKMESLIHGLGFPFFFFFLKVLHLEESM